MSPQARRHVDTDAARPLDGIRVVDLTQILAGPYATMMLADLGADVIKVERPGRGDETREIPPAKHGQSHYFMSVNRNKRSVAVDLKQAEGRQVACALIERSDVLVESFRPGVADRLGLGYAAVSKLNPRLIYCSVSAFGQTGPWAERGGFDVAVQALSGAMSITGEPGRPPVRMGLPIADLAAGLMAVIGTLAALQERASTGHGRQVDVSMLDSMVSLLTYIAGHHFMSGEEPQPVGSGHHNLVPYGAYQARDGYIVIATLTDTFWRKLCGALGLPELGVDPRFDTAAKRKARRAEVEEIVGEVVRTATVAEWQHRLEDADVPHAPILTVGQALGQPQVRARGLVQEFHHPVAGAVKTVGAPLRFGDDPAPPLRPAPLLGEHTHVVLEKLLGYSPAHVRELIDAGIVADVRREGPTTPPPSGR
jgi:crotonobetainyl-CoA:carnitine CoA-transferase CaiB-like acyl-CoA transferase